MKQLQMTGPRTSRIIEVPDLVPGPGQVLIKVKYTGLCMSDWHPWAEAKGGEFMGHEPLGTVVALGEGVTKYKVGDKVTGLCDTPSYAEYCLCRESLVVPVPEDLADEDAVAEPLSCIVSVASKLHLEKPGDTFALVGAGYMGLGLMTLMRAKGAGHIVVVDPRQEARENALRFGADEVYSPEEVPADYIVNDWTGDIFARGFPVVGEFTGTQDGLRLAGDMTGVHGTMGVAGWHQGGDRTVDFRLWGWKGITVINTHERRQLFQAQCCQNALDMIRLGQWNYKGVCNNIYGLDEFDKANTDMENKPKGFIKALVRCTDF